MAHVPIRAHYAAHAWSAESAPRLAAWRAGATGYPMVDAGMRCLYATGWMHQSVRTLARAGPCPPDEPPLGRAPTSPSKRCAW